MARAPHPDPDALSPQTRAALAGLPGNNVFLALAHADAAFAPLMALTASLWNDADLTPRRRELAILRTARLLGSDYEWMHHVEVARVVGPFADADRLQHPPRRAGDRRGTAVEAGGENLVRVRRVDHRRCDVMTGERDAERQPDQSAAEDDDVLPIHDRLIGAPRGAAKRGKISGAGTNRGNPCDSRLGSRPCV